MTARLAIALAAAVTLAAGPGLARSLKRVPAELDPTKAYVLVEYKLARNPAAGTLLAPDYMPITAGLTLGRYDPILSDIRGLGKASGNPLPAGQRPNEPFRNAPIMKGDGARLYLLEVEPDEWVIQGHSGTSFALGSYRFHLEGGVVTDLGIVESATDWADGDRPMSMGDAVKNALVSGLTLGLASKAPPMAPARVSFRPRGNDDLPLPAGLSADQVRPVLFVPDATFGNYLGGLVNRIEGVNALARARSARSGQTIDATPEASSSPQ